MFKKGHQSDLPLKGSSLAGGYLRAVREVSHIPHPVMRVTVHSYNGQYRLRFEVDKFEQSFKFPEADVTLAEVEGHGRAMAEEVLMRFVDMRAQYSKQMTNQTT